MSAVDDIAAYLAYLKTGGNRIDQIIFDEIPNGEEINATEELRRLLDERGVEWDELVGHPVVVGTEWHDHDGWPCTALEHADDVPDGMLSVQANLTPEQAIDAMLGRGECRDMYTDDDEWFACSECNTELRVHEPFGVIGSIRFCPNCGRKVVDE